MKVIGRLDATSLEDIPRQARRLEELGYDGVDQIETDHDGFLTLLLAAEHTRRMILATGVAVAFPRSPMVVANMAWDLQKYSHGRFALGLGSQAKAHNERRFSIKWGSPVSRMREYVQVLRAIWDCWQNGTPLDFQGEHYTFTLMTPHYDPGPIEHPRIPVLIGGTNPAMLRVVGEVGDGVMINNFNTRKYVDEILRPNLEAGAKNSDRPLKDFEVHGGGFIITGENWEEVEKKIGPMKEQIALGYASERPLKLVMDVHGWGDASLRLQEMAAKGRWSEMAREITDEMLETFAVIGTYNEIADKIKARYEDVLTHVIFSPVTHDEREEDRVRTVVEALKAG